MKKIASPSVAFIILINFLVLGFTSKATANEFQSFKSFDGTRISYTFMPANNKNNNDKDTKQKVFVVAQGRATNIKTNMDVYKKLNNLGYHVFTMDWRAHGESDKTIAGTQRCHINSFKIYVRDFNHFIQNIVLKDIEGIVGVKRKNIQLYLFAVSMGGELATRYLQEYSDSHPFEVAFMLAPMYGMNTDPFPRWLAKIVARLTKFAGLSDIYAIGYSDYNPKRAKLKKSRNTSSKEIFEHDRKVAIDNPGMTTGGPTFGWLYAAYKSINNLYKPKNIARIKNFPIYIFIGEKESVVKNDSTRLMFRKLNNASLTCYANCKHLIAKENNQIQEKFWSDFQSIMQELY